MRSEEELRPVVCELLKVIIDSPVNYETWEYETCRDYLDCLLWVLGEFELDTISKGLPLEEMK